MSRSGYSDDGDGESYSLAMWRGIIGSATRGKRGQRFFRDLVGALDAMPDKRLVTSTLETEEGAVCALGALGKRKGTDLKALDGGEDDYGWDHNALGKAFDIAPQLTMETMYINDEAGPTRWVADNPGFPASKRRVNETDEERWTRVRAWAARQIRVTEDELLPDPDGGGADRAVSRGRAREAEVTDAVTEVCESVPVVEEALGALGAVAARRVLSSSTAVTGEAVDR